LSVVTQVVGWRDLFLFGGEVADRQLVGAGATPGRGGA
jgi:hypothetical protein